MSDSSDANAVIFDVDGVLVDSYDAHRESWRLLAGELGRIFTAGQFAATFGRTSREIIREVLHPQATEPQIRQMDDRKELLYRQIIEPAFPAMSGASALIGALHGAGFRLALGSSGPPENIELVIEKLGCRDQLSAVVTGRDVTRGKPDPQVFLIAAQRLSVPPQRCIVIEDAPAGIEAARRAGMLAVALRSTGRESADFSGAALIAASLGELNPARLKSLLNQTAR